MSAKRHEVALVTEGASVLGNACATYLARRGCRVYAMMPDPLGYERRADEFFEVLPSGDGGQSSFDSTVAAVVQAEGRLDLVVSCAGSDLIGAFEDHSVADIRGAFEEGFLKHLRAVRASLPAMRAKGRGRIVCICGCEGRSGMPFMSMTSASSAALNRFIRSLRAEIGAFGLQAAVLERPIIWPDSAVRRKVASLWSELSPYRDRAQRFLSAREADERAGREAMETARMVWNATRGDRMPPVIRAGSLALRLLGAMETILPPLLAEALVKSRNGAEALAAAKRRKR